MGFLGSILIFAAPKGTEPHWDPKMKEDMKVVRVLLVILSSQFRILGYQAKRPSASAAECSLNYSKYAYSPAGDCAHPADQQSQLTVWKNVNSTRCCRNGLNLLSRTLADHSSAQQQESLLLPSQDEWISCTSLLEQDFVTLGSCKFSALRRDNGNCSSLSSIRAANASLFHSILSTCSEFDEPSFADVCSNCTAMISTFIDVIVGDFKVGDDAVEKAICSVAAVTAIASKKSGNDTWAGDFFRCLAAMDSEDRGCKRKKVDGAQISLLVMLGVMSLALLVVLFKFNMRRILDHKKDGERTVSTWSALYRFSKAEVEKAINHGGAGSSSSSRVFLGAGSAGRVYKGVLPSGQLVAVKHIYETATNNKAFTTEAEGLSKVRHHNLVSLLGYCDEDGDKYLVYEYCSEGNLSEKLRGGGLLSWEKRVNILRDCSVALRFLHTHPDGCIVHRDIKLTNILLMEEMRPKLSDFGLARMVGMKETQCYSDVRGTIGYMDPEYMSNGNLTCSSDIYSFGIVILQVLSGRKVIELNTQARDTLTRSAKDVKAGKRPLTDFVDPRIRGEVNLEDFKSILRVAVLCVGSSDGRPRISDLVGVLDTACGNLNTKMGQPSQRKEIYGSMSQIQSPELIEV